MQPLLRIPVIAAIFLLTSAPAVACTVCHSKNPKMVNMHRELGFKDCFNCHGQGPKVSPEEQKRQMTTDGRCTGCHRRD